MKLHFIGTSHGVPEATRKWTSVFLEVNRSLYAIDAGSFLSDGIIASGRSLNDLKAVFITHRHGDHMNGLLPLVDVVSWYFKESKPVIFFPEEGIAERLRALRDASYASPHPPLDSRVISEGCIYEDENIRIRAIKTKHVNPSYAFIAEAEGKKLLFTGDMHSSLSDYPREAYEEELELVVCEGAHFRLAEREEILKKTNTKRLVVSHYYYKMNEQSLAGFAERMPFPVDLAEDGTEIDL